MKMFYILSFLLMVSEVASSDTLSDLRLSVSLENWKVRVVIHNTSNKAIEYYTLDTSSKRFNFPGSTTVRARRLGGWTFCYPNNSGSYWNPWAYWSSQTINLPVTMKILEAQECIEATGDVHEALQFVPSAMRNFPLWEVTEVKLKTMVALDPMLKNLVTAETPWLPVKFDE